MKKLLVVVVMMMFVLYACDSEQDLGRRNGSVPDTVRIAFDTQGGNALDPLFVETGELFNLSSRTPTKEGYTFMGWYQDQDFTVRVDGNLVAEEPITLYALWQVSSFTISYFDRDNVVLNSVDYQFNQSISLDEGPFVEGYTFEGWFEQGSLFDATTMPARDLDLVASYTVNIITFTFNVLGEVTEVSGAFGTSVNYPEDPNIDGLIFKGWTRTPGFEEDYRVNDFPAQNWDLIAYFDEIEYTLSFDENFADLTFTVLNPPLEPTIEPERLGHTFTGWYLDEDFEMLFDFNNPPASDTQLYAGFIVNTYTITFINPRGEDPHPFDVEFLAEIPVLPTIEDDAFIGWFIEEASGAFDDTVMMASDIVLIARFNDDD